MNGSPGDTGTLTVDAQAPLSIGHISNNGASRMHLDGEIHVISKMENASAFTNDNTSPDAITFGDNARIRLQANGPCTNVSGFIELDFDTAPADGRTLSVTPAGDTQPAATFATDGTFTNCAFLAAAAQPLQGLRLRQHPHRHRPLLRPRGRMVLRRGDVRRDGDDKQQLILQHHHPRHHPCRGRGYAYAGQGRFPAPDGHGPHDSERDGDAQQHLYRPPVRNPRAPGGDGSHLPHPDARRRPGLRLGADSHRAGHPPRRRRNREGACPIHMAGAAVCPHRPLHGGTDGESVWSDLRSYKQEEHSHELPALLLPKKSVDGLETGRLPLRRPGASLPQHLPRRPSRRADKLHGIARHPARLDRDRQGDGPRREHARPIAARHREGCPYGREDRRKWSISTGE